MSVKLVIRMTDLSPDPRLPQRHRGFQVLCLGAVVCLGLGSRAETFALPAVVAKYGGDALWGMMIFLGVGLLLPASRTACVAGLAFGICCIVEFSQLYHAPWLDAARRTRLGALALGDTFAWRDIAAYFVGIAVAAIVEWAVRRPQNTKKPNQSTASKVE